MNPRIPTTSPDGGDRPIGIWPRLAPVRDQAAPALRQHLRQAFCLDHPACEVGTRFIDAALPAVAAWLREVGAATGDEAMHRLADDLTRDRSTR